MKKQAICSNAFILNDKNEVLVVKRNEKDDAFPSEWELPGGTIEYGETAEESLVREVEEECGIEVNIGKPLHVSNFYIGEEQCFEITYLCKLTDSEKKPKLSAEHTDYRWIKLSEVENAGLNKYISSVLISAVKALSHTS